MAASLRVGIIGTGRAETAHAAYQRLPGGAVTAVRSRTHDRADALAATLRQSAQSGQAGAPPVQVFGTWQELLHQGAVDAISLTTMLRLRHAPFSAAVARGVPVLVEKPLSAELPEARAMAALAAAAPVVTAISFDSRYSPVQQVAWRAVQAGEIGRIREVRLYTSLVLNQQTLANFAQKRWTTGQGNGGGMLREWGMPHFDRVRFFTGQEFRFTGQEFRHVAARLTPLHRLPWPVPSALGPGSDGEYATPYSRPPKPPTTSLFSRPPPRINPSTTPRRAAGQALRGARHGGRRQPRLHLVARDAGGWARDAAGLGAACAWRRWAIVRARRR